MKIICPPKGGGLSGLSFSREESVIHGLRSNEAHGVLHRLLEAHPDLRGEAEQIAKALLNDTSFTDIADEVEFALRALDIDDLNAHAGPDRWGYTSPDEAAWQLLEEALEPFQADVQRHIDLGMEEVALAICRGVILGLYRIRDTDADDFLSWAPDFPKEAAEDTLRIWREGGKNPPTKRPNQRRPEYLMDFTKEWVPEWSSLITGFFGDMEGRMANPK